MNNILNFDAWKIFEWKTEIDKNKIIISPNKANEKNKEQLKNILIDINCILGTDSELIKVSGNYTKNNYSKKINDFFEEYIDDLILFYEYRGVDRNKNNTKYLENEFTFTNKITNGSNFIKLNDNGGKFSKMFNKLFNITKDSDNKTRTKGIGKGESLLALYYRNVAKTKPDGIKNGDFGDDYYDFLNNDGEMSNKNEINNFIEVKSAGVEMSFDGDYDDELEKFIKDNDEFKAKCAITLSKYLHDMKKSKANKENNKKTLHLVFFDNELKNKGQTTSYGVSGFYVFKRRDSVIETAKELYKDMVIDNESDEYSTKANGKKDFVLSAYCSSDGTGHLKIHKTKKTINKQKKKQ